MEQGPIRHAPHLPDGETNALALIQAFPGPYCEADADSSSGGYSQSPLPPDPPSVGACVRFFCRCAGGAFWCPIDGSHPAYFTTRWASEVVAVYFAVKSVRRDASVDIHRAGLTRRLFESLESSIDAVALSKQSSWMQDPQAHDLSGLPAWLEAQGFVSPAGAGVYRAWPYSMGLLYDACPLSSLPSGCNVAAPP